MSSKRKVAAQSVSGGAKRVLALFDVDGTLTPARKPITPEMRAFMQRVSQKITIAVVGGSDFAKQREQLGEHSLDDFSYSFAENGLVAYKGRNLIHERSIAEFLGEDKLKTFINFVLHYIADLDIPIKRGTFIEFRKGMLNVSPIGRNCSQAERDEFYAFDAKAKIREQMVAALEKKFGKWNLQFSIGGQISLDVFPKGWDKTYSLRHVRDEGFDEIHFFGDKTAPGGNDFEIFTSKEVIGHTVTNPDDTRQQLTKLFLSSPTTATKASPAAKASPAKKAKK